MPDLIDMHATPPPANQDSPTPLCGKNETSPVSEISLPFLFNASSRPLSRTRTIVFLILGSRVGLAFFCIYPFINWLAGYRDYQHELFFAWELNIPFMPEFIWLYLSMYVLFLLPPFFLPPKVMERLARALIWATCIAGFIFLTFPARLGFPRIVPSDPLYRPIFEVLFSIDRPYNLVPSLHVVYSAAIILAIASRQIGRSICILLFCWLIAIMASTLFIHQHHFLDVLSALALALLMHCHVKERNV